MMKVLRVLFGCYAAIVFSLSLLIVFPAYFLIFSLTGRNKSARYAHNLSRLWALFLFRCFFIRYEVRNSHYIHPDKCYVFAANHKSMLDIPLFARSCSNTFRFLSKAELARIPLLGYVIRRLYITVNRSDRRDRQRSIEVMKKTIEEGISVFLCPEGTRNISDAPLMPFKDGAFRLAIATQTPLAVLTVVNSDKLLSPESPIALSPGKIIAEWSVPVSTKGMTEKDVEFLKNKTIALMEGVLQKHSTKN